MTNEELYWLAGLLEGEGSFLRGPPSKPNQPIVVAMMTDEDVVDKVAKLLGTAMVRNKPDGRGDWKPTFSARLRGKKAVELMKQLRPLMGKRRQEQIDRAIASYKDHSNRVFDEDTAASIRQRALAGESMRKLQQEFGVSYSTISKIKYGMTWKTAA